MTFHTLAAATFCLIVPVGRSRPAQNGRIAQEAKTTAANGYRENMVSIGLSCHSMR
jgi:hypothetical protein